MRNYFAIVLFVIALALYTLTRDVALAILCTSVLGIVLMLFRILGLGERPIGGWLVTIPMTSLAVASLARILHFSLPVSALIFIGGFALFFYLLVKGSDEIVED